MLSSVRAGLVAALTLVALVPAFAADKPFHRSDLDEAAIRLEAQIKNDAGSVTKPVATLKRDADAAFQKKDYRNGMVVLGQIVTAAPNDAASWLRLARAISQIRPRDDREKALLLDRASTAAYIAYQRASARTDEAESLALLGSTLADRKLWRAALDSMRMALDLRETADLRGEYEKLRAEHGFRLLDYTVDSDATSPRACFQFSEDLPGKRTDFSPFVAVAGMDKPAVSVTEKQLCVEGLKHGERYTVTLRAGLPSVVKETLAKSADFAVYVRDRKPFVRFSGKSYVLPRSGQRGIPIVSVNTRKVGIEIYRIGDRSLIDSVVGGDHDRTDFQRSLDRYEVDRLGQARGVQVWKGDLAVESTLNTEITTAFPVDQAVGDLAPGVYVMVAEPQPSKAESYDALATQWFIVSDLGLTAFSGNDGIHVFVNSLASTDAKDGIEVRLISRSNEVLATRRTDATGHAQFEAGLARGEGGMAPALLVAADPKGDYAFLNLKTPAFDLTDRGVGGRIAPAGLDAFVYPERGVYRTG
ncbi:MAG: alpha-2-macroglobulin family protein, partial [Pseudolabrys sp.]